MKTSSRAIFISVFQVVVAALSLLFYFPKHFNFFLVALLFPGGLICLDHNLVLGIQKSTNDVGIYIGVIGFNIGFWWWLLAFILGRRNDG